MVGSLGMKWVAELVVVTGKTMVGYSAACLAEMKVETMATTMVETMVDMMVGNWVDVSVGLMVEWLVA